MSDLEPNDIQRGRNAAVALEPTLVTAPAGNSRGQTPAVRALALKIEKVFGLADVDYDQVVRAGTFIFWGKPEQAHFVALRSAAR